MAKNVPVIEFSISDTPKPKKSLNGAISLRAPFPLTLKPAASAFIDFGYSCSVPLIVTGNRLHPASSIFSAGATIKVQVQNSSLTDDAVFEVGDTLLVAYPVIPSEFEIK